MNPNLDAVVSLIRETRTTKKASLQSKRDKLKKELDTVLGTKNKVWYIADNNPDVKDKLSYKCFDSAVAALNEAVQKCEVALLRLNRESINIAVAGKARQGKSQLLQMLTGLGDGQIPTGSGDFCTAARNIVVNGPDQKAVIFYLSESAILEKKVYPAYKALNLSPMPRSIDDFVNSVLPVVSQDNCATSTYKMWENVEQLHNDFKSNPDLRKKLSVKDEVVSLNSVRAFLVKDNGETLHQVVDHVEITTPFEVNLPQGMLVVDLPGLEDPTPGIKETMLKSVSEDADIVLLLRRPDSVGDGWKDNDYEVMDDLEKVYADVNLQPRDWVQCVLNLDNRPGSCNKANVERMKNKAPRGFVPVVCDCGSKDSVREMINNNVDALIRKTSKIDDLRIAQAEDAFKTAEAEISALYRTLKNVTSDIVLNDDGFDFDKHLRGFMGDLRDPFRHGINADFLDSVLGILRNHFEATQKDLDELYAANENSDCFPEKFPAFSKARLLSEYKASRGSSGPIEKATRNQREALLKLIRNHFDDCTSELLQQYYDCVYEYGLKKSPAIKMILSGAKEEDCSSRDKIEKLKSLFERNGALPTLTSAVEKLLNFQLSFDGTILPSVFALEGFKDFDPEDKNNYEYKEVSSHIFSQENSVDRADVCYNWLKSKSEEILGAATSCNANGPISEINSYVVKSMRANFEAFTYRFIWGDDCEKEWKRFVNENKADFWKDEYEKAQMNSQLGKDWNNALAALAEFAN